MARRLECSLAVSLGDHGAVHMWMSGCVDHCAVPMERIVRCICGDHGALHMWMSGCGDHGAVHVWMSDCM
eukprot:1158768-Pelagomonas_calceolata.AAC.9